MTSTAIDVVPFFTAFLAAVSMYFLVARHNARDAQAERFDRYVGPLGAAIFTGIAAAIATPIIFYRMRGKIGFVYAIAFVLGMMITSRLCILALYLWG